MIRILVQQFEDRSTQDGYIQSFQFTVTDRIDSNLALDILLDWLRTSRILVESKHRAEEGEPSD